MASTSSEYAKRKQIELYFMRFPMWAVGVIAVAIALVASLGALVLYGLEIVVSLVAGVFLFRWFQRPSAKQMDTWLREDLASLHPKALRACSIDATEQVRDPVIIVGPRYRNLGGAEFAIRRSADKKIRYTPVNVTIINFTQHQLVLYQCCYDRTTGKALNEGVHEYFYDDVVSVTIQSLDFILDKSQINGKMMALIPEAEKQIVNGKLHFHGASTFVLTTSGGTSVKVVLRDPILIESLSGEDASTETAEEKAAKEAAEAVRKMLRDKKRR